MEIKETIINKLVEIIEPITEIIFTSAFKENYFKTSSNKSIKSIDSIRVDRNWQNKYKDKTPLYYKTNDYSFIENGIYYLNFNTFNDVDLTELYTILINYYDSNEMKFKVKIMNILKESNQLNISEIVKIKKILDINI